MSSLTDLDRIELIDRYTARFAQHGVDTRTLNVGDPAKYARQHAIHAAIGRIEATTILDIGCGLANFHDCLNARGTKVHYVGYDLVEPFITVNRSRFPEATFRLIDISRDDIVDRCDYAVMCQVFNNKYRESSNVAVVQSAMRKAFAAVERGISIDMLSAYVSRMEDDLFYYAPEQMFTFAKSLTPYVSLLHGYLDHHFTIQLFKERLEG